VWHDSGRIVQPFPCGTQPAGFPLHLAKHITFDEQEHPAIPPQGPPIIPGQPPPAPTDTVFPAEANRVHIGGESYPVPFDFGWLFLELNDPYRLGFVSQSWVETVMKAQGQYSVGFSATPLAGGCEPIPLRPGG
jgi:hypothetical protein